MGTRDTRESDVDDLVELLADARAEERERCADLCEGRPEGRSCAAAIRRLASTHAQPEGK
jgi:hypothetical protein